MAERIIQNNIRNVENTRRIYDQEAPIYDDDYSDLLTLAGDRVVINFLSREVRSLVRQRIRQTATTPFHLLDLGCGTGFITQSLPFQELSIQVIGVELSLGMLEQARGKERLRNVSLIQADMHNTPFGDSTFDMVISTYGPISYSLDPQRVIQEVSRVLKPGGRFIAMPYTARLGSKIATGFSTAHSEDTKKVFYSAQTSRNLFEQGSFTNVEIFGLNYLGKLIQQAINIRSIEDVLSLIQNSRSLIRLDRWLKDSNPREDMNQRLRELRLLQSDKDESSGYSGPGYWYIATEFLLFHALGIEPGLGRHMIVTADKKNSNYG